MVDRTAGGVDRDPKPTPMETDVGRPARPRLESLDTIRGLVMVLMALDHVRTFLGPTFEGEDLSQVGTALFLTRWVTHFCAPTFVLLAGAGAYFRGTRARSPRELAGYLFTRGLFLLALELTLIKFLWSFRLDYQFAVIQVIGAIGLAMIGLAALVRLPASAVGLIGVAVLAAHNLGDGVIPLGPAGRIWDFLHSMRIHEWAPDRRLFVLYPPLPWFGMIAAGYGFGRLIDTTPDRRRSRCFALGVLLSLAFLLLRAAGVYGDPRPWSPGGGPLPSLLAFGNTEKYPPSLLFTLMTLGPAILAIGLAERVPSDLTRPLRVFGRVPLFFYVLHLLLIHLVAIGLAQVVPGHAEIELGPGGSSLQRFGLPVVYLVWLAVLLVLWPACLAFGRFKFGRRRGTARGPLSYF